MKYLCPSSSIRTVLHSLFTVIIEHKSEFSQESVSEATGCKDSAIIHMIKTCHCEDGDEWQKPSAGGASALLLQSLSCTKPQRGFTQFNMLTEQTFWHTSSDDVITFCLYRTGNKNFIIKHLMTSLIFVTSAMTLKLLIDKCLKTFQCCYLKDIDYVCKVYQRRVTSLILMSVCDSMWSIISNRSIFIETTIDQLQLGGARARGSLQDNWIFPATQGT